jgi:hypothetical protein
VGEQDVGDQSGAEPADQPGDQLADQPVELVVVSRFRVDPEQVGEAGVAEFRVAARAALGALAARPGYVAGQLGRNLDDPTLWLLTTSWANVGSYRRALSSYDVKVTAVPLLSQAVDEPSAYETDRLGWSTNEQRPRDLR